MRRGVERGTTKDTCPHTHTHTERERERRQQQGLLEERQTHKRRKTGNKQGKEKGKKERTLESYPASSSDEGAANHEDMASPRNTGFFICSENQVVNNSQIHCLATPSPGEKHRDVFSEHCCLLALKATAAGGVM